MIKEIDQASDIFKSLVWNSLVKAATNALFAAVPFLAWGPVGWLVNIIITKFADFLFAQAKEFIIFEAIQFRNKELQSKFDLASVELKLIAINKGVDSDDFKQARAKNVNDLSAFIRFDVAR